ncbi:F-box protein At5g07610-like [Rutidosis leptorrhynchoides]|uniref:F-box protein At5g07610-like n=1 Tax=Rutidosis leptorrhynchoides TaxID=125765 RepID=UPI003A99E34A
MPSDASSPTPLLLAVAHTVGSSQDLVTEILQRLPVRSLILFKSVSKHWRSLITNHPCFKNPNKPPDPPSGLFLPILFGYVFVPFDIYNRLVKFHRRTILRKIDPVPDIYFTSSSSNGLMLCGSIIVTGDKLVIDKDYVYKSRGRKILHNIDPDIKFKHSCNGLMLFGNVMWTNDKLVTDKNYVFNPTINQFIRLPVPSNVNNVLGMNIAFDPFKSPHYKVIYVYDDFDYGSGTYNYQIEVYSSNTRTCKPLYNLTIDRFSSDMNFSAGVYWNNAIHWIDGTGFIVYFDLDKDTSYEIKTPFAHRDLDCKNYICYICESRDQFLLVEIYHPHITKFKIFELKRDYSDWLVKYLVDLEEFGESLFPKTVSPPPFCSDALEFDVLSLVLGIDGDDEYFLVVEIPGKIMRLNLASKTYHVLRTFGPSHRIKCEPELYQWPNVYQFAASLYSL